MTLGIHGRHSYCAAATELLASLSCFLLQLPFCQNWRSNAVGRITKESSGRIAEHRYEQYQLLLFPSGKTLFQVGIFLQTFLSFLREAGFVNLMPTINLRVLLLCVINWVLALNFISHTSPEQESTTFSFTSSWRWIISHLNVYNSCEDSTQF